MFFLPLQVPRESCHHQGRRERRTRLRRRCYYENNTGISEGRGGVKEAGEPEQMHLVLDGGTPHSKDTSLCVAKTAAATRKKGQEKKGDSPKVKWASEEAK